jgi:TetR/AcrR family transcriptional regulator, transcriptional repressor for nem operon
MTTREAIINTADLLIRGKGYNAFSFKDISESIGIKTASIHYHFPTKTDLGVATIQEHFGRFERLKAELSDKDPLLQLIVFLEVYSQIEAEGRVCLVGSLATDLNTVDDAIKTELKAFAQMILDWITAIVAEGQQQKLFEFECSPRTKALMIISNMLAIVQLSRLTSTEDVELVKRTIINELKAK